MPKELLLEKPLPSSPDVERAGLGSVMLDNRLIDEAVADWTLDDFYSMPLRKIFSAMIQLHQQKMAINEITINAELSRRKEDVGGIVFLSNLSYGLPAAANLKAYTKILKEKSNARWGFKEATRLQQAFLDESEDPQSIFATATDRFSAMREKSLDGDSDGLLSSFIPQVEDHLYSLMAGVNLAVPTGLADLDRLSAGGIRPGELWGIAARSSRGKSSILVQMLLHMAKQGRPVALFSLETQALSVTLRILASEAGVSMSALRAPGPLREGEIMELIRILPTKLNAPIHIFTRGYKSVQEIKRKVASLNKKLGAGKRLATVGIDWYGKLSAGVRGYESARTQELKYIADFLQQEIAIGEDVGLIVPAQFNRSGWKDNDPGPGNVDGGEAYHDACDLFAVLNTEPAILKSTDGKQMSKASLKVFKQRNGPIAVGKEALKLIFNRTQMQFFSRLEGAGEEVPEKGDWQSPSNTPEHKPVEPGSYIPTERERADFL
jgi:replicative DNA helicase